MPTSREDVLDAATAAGLTGADLDAFMADEGFAPEKVTVAVVKPVDRFTERAVKAAPKVTAPAARTTASPASAPITLPTQVVVAERPRTPAVMTSTYAEKVPASEVVGRALGRMQSAVVDRTPVPRDQRIQAEADWMARDRAEGERLAAARKVAPPEPGVMELVAKGYNDTRKDTPKPPAQPASMATDEAKRAAAEALGMPAPSVPEVVVRPLVKAPPPADRPMEGYDITTLDGARAYLLSTGASPAKVDSLRPERLLKAAADHAGGKR